MLQIGLGRHRASYTTLRTSLDTYHGQYLYICLFVLLIVCVHFNGVECFGDTCALPFRYNGKWYFDCITSGNDGTPWCATTHDFDSDFAWGTCSSHTSNGRQCNLPFKYQGKVYHNCITHDHPQPWCATTDDYDRDNEWGVCHVFTQHGETCVFPFEYQGKKYYWCTLADNGMPWCATTDSYDRDKKWDLCVYYIS